MPSHKLINNPQSVMSIPYECENDLSTVACFAGIELADYVMDRGHGFKAVGLLVEMLDMNIDEHEKLSKLIDRPKEFDLKELTELRIYCINLSREIEGQEEPYEYRNRDKYAA